jgi:hypothetical protein
VAVYTHKEPRLLLRGYEGQRIHKAEAIEFYAIERALIDELVEHLDRRVALTLSVSDRHLFVDVGGESLSGTVERHPLP